MRRGFFVLPLFASLVLTSAWAATEEREFPDKLKANITISYETCSTTNCETQVVLQKNVELVHKTCPEGGGFCYGLEGFKFTRDGTQYAFYLYSGAHRTDGGVYTIALHLGVAGDRTQFAREGLYIGRDPQPFATHTMGGPIKKVIINGETYTTRPYVTIAATKPLQNTN